MRPLWRVVALAFFSLCLFSFSFAASDPVASADPPGGNEQVQKEENPNPGEDRKVKEPARLLELVGAEGRKIVITMDAPLQRHFPIRVKSLVKNPLEVKVVAFPLRKDGDTVTARLLPAGQSEEQPVVSGKSDSTVMTLKPGEERGLEISLDANLSKGNYAGILVFRDIKGEHLQEFDLAIKNPYVAIRTFHLFEPNRYPKAFVFILVFLGAVTSLFLSKFPTVSSTKASNRERITDLRERILRLTAFERDLGAKLTVELVKAETLNTNTKVYTPSADERFKAIETQLNKIDEQLRIRQEISNRYVEIDSADCLPFSMEQQVRRLLKEADQGLYMDRPDLAEARKKEAEGLLKCEPSMIREQAEGLFKKIDELLKKLGGQFKEDADSEELCKELIRNIGEFPGDAEVHADELRKGLPSAVKERLKGAVGDDQELADGAKKRELLGRLMRLDLSFNKAYIYHNYLHRKKDSDIEAEEQENLDAEIGELINSGLYKGLEEAQILIRSLEMEVTDKRIKDVLSGKEFSIVTFPSDPTLNNLVKFKVVFKADEINKSPLIKTGRFRYIWDFGDDTSRAEGDEVSHYFKRRGSFILFRKWIRRTLSVLKLRQVEWKSFPLSVEVFGSDGTSLVTMRDKVSVREALDREYSSGITITAFMGFVLTLLISTVVAMTTTYEETYSFKSLKDVLAPFLLGFGLDISREKLQEAAKGVGSKKEKG
ncbi:MAG: hypothetical protein WC291_02975 [Thermodesulfovibrionales bacterium]